MKLKVPEAGAQDAPSASPVPSPRVWLEVRDARETAVSLARHGVHPLADPLEVFTGWAVEVSDPWGNVIGFTDYTKAPARARHR